MKNQDDQLTSLGRFSEPALYILISLADGPKHGYAMTQDIASVSGQKLGPKETLTDIERDKLGGKNRDPGNP